MELISLSSALRQLCSKDVTNLSIQSPHEALRIPLPPLEQQTPDLAILMMTTQFQLLATLLRAAADTATNWKLLMSKLASILLPDSKDTVIQWKQDCQDIKKADVLLMSIYSLILKSTATLEALEDKPDSLQTLQVRLYACACFSNTSAFVSADSPDEMDKKRIEAYWDQVKKVVVLYFRSEGLLNGPVKIFDATAFLSLFESFTHLAFLPQHEKHFQVINQTLLQIGRRLDNLQLVEFVSRTATTSTESGVPATAESDLLSSSMLLDRWRKSSAPFPAENLLRVCGWIEEFACAGSANLERLRSAAFKGLKEKNEVSKEERDVLCKVLDMLSACVEKFPRVSIGSSILYMLMLFPAGNAFRRFRSIARWCYRHVTASCPSSTTDFIQQSIRLLISNNAFDHHSFRPASLFSFRSMCLYRILQHGRYGSTDTRWNEWRLDGCSFRSAVLHDSARCSGGLSWSC